MLKVSFTRRIDSNEHRNILPVSRGGELQTGGGEEEVVKNSSLITSPPFIHISREDSSLSLARGEKGRAGEEGEGETPRRVAIATPIIGCLQLPARLRQREKASERANERKRERASERTNERERRGGGSRSAVKTENVYCTKQDRPYLSKRILQRIA